jgi:hypothetical protein
MNVETSLTSFKIKANHLFGINTEKAGLADDSLKMISLQSGKLYGSHVTFDSNEKLLYLMCACDQV